MAKEIERKFLLASDGWRGTVVRKREICQGYLGGAERVSIRVRVSGNEAWLNIKCGGLEVVRDEYEYAIPIDDARALLAVASVPLIEKVRYYVPYRGFTWEIDEFCGANAGLIVAEIELDSEGEDIPLPPWVGKEITLVPRYYNVSLARRPYSDWTDAECAT